MDKTDTKKGTSRLGAHSPDSYHLLPERWEHCLRGHSRVCAHIMVRASVRLTPGRSSFARPPSPIQNCSRSSVGDRVPSRGTSLTGSVRSLSIYSTPPLVALYLHPWATLGANEDTGFGGVLGAGTIQAWVTHPLHSSLDLHPPGHVGLAGFVWAPGVCPYVVGGCPLYTASLSCPSAIACSLARRSFGANCVWITSPSLASPSSSYHAASYRHPREVRPGEGTDTADLLQSRPTVTRTMPRICLALRAAEDPLPVSQRVNTNVGQIHRVVTETRTISTKNGNRCSGRF